MAAKQWLELVPLLQRAVDAHGPDAGAVDAHGPNAGALDGVAVLSPGGEPVGYAGALAHYEVRALAALVSRDGPPDLLRRLFDGELAATTLGHETGFAGQSPAATLDQRARSAGDAATTLGHDTSRGGDVTATTFDHEPRLTDELAATSLERRTVFLGIAGRCVFVVAVAAVGADLARSRSAASDLRDDIERLIRSARARLGATWVPPAPDSSGSSSPAEAFAWPPRPRVPGGKN